MNSYFYLQDGLVIQDRSVASELIQQVEEYAQNNKIQIYVLNSPLAEGRYSYPYRNGFVILLPKHQILFVDCGNDEESFSNYVDDFIEDIGSLSDKYTYKDHIGRPREWRRHLIRAETFQRGDDIEDVLEDIKIDDPALARKGELLISLATGSINDIANVKVDVPEAILDKVKRKIILFDGDQTRFIYGKSERSRVRIQGISGAGKTELLLHKLKELYVQDSDSKIAFTCHNKILADSLRKRIPEFFNFMKVESQIAWDERLWCVHGWGSGRDINSGTYRHICHVYGVKFETFGTSSFDEACKKALTHIQQSDDNLFAFDYILIDESQDFPDSFFDLCERAAKKQVYIAGDIFQSIFDISQFDRVNSDFVLRKCYRTDPRTLMFAHMVGMGLSERQKMRWLNDAQWEACGYQIEKEGRRYSLTREPLRRFEDIDDDEFESVKISTYGNALVSDVINKIREIRNEHPTVRPDDIGIIFAEVNKGTFAAADQLEVEIAREFGWKVNKAHETKEKIKNSVFVSNRNHAKGLEFPFVVCVMGLITYGYLHRNALYMILSRSFIKTYFLAAHHPENVEFLQRVSNGLLDIVENAEISTIEPTDPEKDQLRQTVMEFNERLSLHELLQQIFNELRVEKQYKSAIAGMVQNIEGLDEYEEDYIRSFVEVNYQLLKKKKGL